MTEDIIVVVFAPKRMPERKFIQAVGQNNDPWSYVVLDSLVMSKDKINVKSAISNDSVFVLINQCQSETKISEIIRQFPNDTNKKYIFWLHQTEEAENDIIYPPYPIEKALNEISADKIVSYYYFSHGDDCSKQILNWMSLFKDNIDWNADLNKIVTRIVAVKNEKTACTIQSNLLTPFIPFHIAYQKGNKIDCEWRTVLKLAAERMNDGLIEELEQFIRLLKIAPVENKINLHAQMNSLMSKCKNAIYCEDGSCFNQHHEITANIEWFASSLESELNHVQSGVTL